jgi:hypothetical protein
MFALLLARSLSAVLGIDLGDSLIKAAVGWPSGRIHALDPIPNSLCLDHGTITFGEAASTLRLSQPDLCARAISLSRHVDLPLLEGYKITAIALSRLA